MPKRTPDPEWYVFIENFNSKTIKTFNVFNSYNFQNGCRKAFKKFKPEQTEELSKEIKGWAIYSFRYKCEYEIVLQGWAHNDVCKKIDVYDQLIMNWDSFFKYVLEHRAYFLRRKSNEKS